MAALPPSASAAGSSTLFNSGEPQAPSSQSAQHRGHQQQQQHNAQQQPQQHLAAPNQSVPAPPAHQPQALARIIKLKQGNTHSNQPLARVVPPQQGMVVDPAEVECIHANLTGAKDDSKKWTLPALCPGHKVSALSLCESIAISSFG
ncbi:uncharacterized protein EDB93DRAFT_1250144 [Suillus bovinus]|uniref:uncharacterized protein n=1 Tax=Suillus bovinus TaxID=48563 RepID=UPI001B8726A6|nr:uncharacterized protein EDB93DRAFT_1250144 [Suillus bovinus]KAG2148709.1 hypothetical protein EDB93DRAFT_1250144 [Suillus bovinus]